jgi:hypothetical protein
MHGVPQSNPPNPRSLRKFISGDIWEWIVGVVLTFTGVLQYRQVRGEVELPGCLKVTGKLDFVCGGVIDWKAARLKAETLRRLFTESDSQEPRFIMHAVTHIIEAMERRYKNKPLREIIMECKAISARMSEKIERTQKPMPHNVLQAAHYLIADKTLTGAKINYVCKDDNIMSEFDLEKERRIIQLYREDVETMTMYYKQSNERNPMKTMPPKEPLILFDPTAFRFEKNFKVEYSGYLTLLYGYKAPIAYDDAWKGKVSSWNRVFKRCVKGEKITDKNKVVLTEVVKNFPDWDKWVYKAKSVGAFQNEKEEE